MKTVFILFITIFVLSFSCKNETTKQSDGPYKSEYNDGSYEGISRSIYTYEPFYGKVDITIQNGRLTQIEFMIRDSSIHEDFNGDYEKHYANNPLYIDQCRNDWKGVQSYPDSLLKHQKIDNVDAISAATWSYNIFKASTIEALKKAKKSNI